ncbi:hypothetical protein BO70DRAFT_33608 [Aspergillus heteromorphus CBS 117.55]|uniref:Uncharacterized protein n=1 Tax=Aspergillus heteromorphus CBS 117.55 TaxID=1448321 RepID=A0A317W9J3_9EURO|nr:uncharacterized protein BO70DRAFT_33608 [Aspergillus heteromorphus CBS 117.55]PWY83003.1 hypothetical protein BO70DRAFT_33608 [Aspergillus heteromorphus CBS 117.55]
MASHVVGGCVLLSQAICFLADRNSSNQFIMETESSFPPGSLILVARTIDRDYVDYGMVHWGEIMGILYTYNERYSNYARLSAVIIIVISSYSICSPCTE